MPQSRTLTVTWATPGPIQDAPGAPSVITGSLPSKMMEGHMEDSRRFPGAIELTRPGLGSNVLIAPFMTNPVSLAMKPDGFPRVCVIDTTRPLLSTHDTWVVCFDSGLLSRVRSAFSPRRILSAHSLA